MFAVFPAAAQDTQPMMQPMQKPMMMMGDMMDAPVVPPVVGYADGEQILFLHTETSDPEIARILTDMMGSPVLVVPAVAVQWDGCCNLVFERRTTTEFVPRKVMPPQEGAAAASSREAATAARAASAWAGPRPSAASAGPATVTTTPTRPPAS